LPSVRTPRQTDCPRCHLVDQGRTDPGIEQPRASAGRVGSVACRQGSPVLRLEQIDVAPPGDVVGVSGLTDKSTARTVQPQAAPANRTRQERKLVCQGMAGAGRDGRISQSFLTRR
jgi:hypothetical protein